MRAAAMAILCIGLAGCAHTQSQYAYAPPLLPPVYPQPQPVAAPPAPHPTQPGVMPAAAVPGPVAPPLAAAAECCPPLGPGEVLATPVVYEEGQMPPCPPGP
jgi:hypothetical protein